MQKEMEMKRLLLAALLAAGAAVPGVASAHPYGADRYGYDSGYGRDRGYYDNYRYRDRDSWEHRHHRNRWRWERRHRYEHAYRDRDRYEWRHHYRYRDGDWRY